MGPGSAPEVSHQLQKTHPPGKGEGRSLWETLADKEQVEEMVQIYGPIGVRRCTCRLGQPLHPTPCVFPALKPEAPGHFGNATALTKSQRWMVQVQMSPQDPDPTFPQAHLGCETPGLGRRARERRREQESWARALLGSVGVCEARSLGASLPTPAPHLPGGASRPHRVPEGREATEVRK